MRGKDSKVRAVFSPSERAWIRYSKEKIVAKVNQWDTVQRGVDLHALAAEAIRLQVQLSSENGVISQYVRDAITYDCEVEVPLSYSQYIYGTADALRFDFSTKTLYVFDLKTGKKEASTDQVLIYAAMWCLINNIDPYDIDFDLRIYSDVNTIILRTEDNSGIQDKVRECMDSIVFVDNTVNEYKGGQ